MVVAQVTENQGGSVGRLTLAARVGEGDALLGLVSIVDANGGATLGQGVWCRRVTRGFSALSGHVTPAEQTDLMAGTLKWNERNR